MASPVDTTIKHFTSIMLNAPALSGTKSSLNGLLETLLVTGFDIKALTSLTVAGGVATAAYSGTHSAGVDTVVLIAGVTGGPTGWSQLNGEQKITAKPDASSVKFATTLPDGTYSGTITMKMAPLGFEKLFSGTDLAAFRSTDPASTKMILRVDDSAATVARVVGCESMTDINTYSGLFPTATQMSGGGYWGKSSTANSTPVQWALIGDSRGFFLHVCPAWSAANPVISQGVTRYFGDSVVLKPGGDAYACSLSYSTSSAPASQNDGQPEFHNNNFNQAFPRPPTGLGTALLCGCYAYTGATVACSGADTYFGSFPSVIDGALRLSKRYFASGGASPPRAELPGLYSVPHSNVSDSFRFNDRVPGTGALTGRNLFAINTASVTLNSAIAPSNAGAAFIDITGPWLR